MSHNTSRMAVWYDNIVKNLNRGEVISMNNTKIYFLSATSGKSENGDYYKVSLHFSEDANGKFNEFSVDFFVDVDTYTKCKTFQRFQEVDGVFMPNKKGFSKLVSIEGL